MTVGESETETTTARPSEHRTWTAGVVSGLVAGVGMGLVLQFGADAMPLVGALFGMPTVVGGWAVHLLTSVLFALLFAAVVSSPLLSDYTGTVGGTTGLGVLYGAGLGVVTGGLLLPLWLNAVRAEALPVPLLPLPAVVGEFVLPVVLGVGHLVYGALLGAIFALAR